MATHAKSAPKEHPLVNILINVLLPVLALSYLSKDSAFEAVPRPWHLGPANALAVALLMPLGYGVWHFTKTRKTNFFSALGLVSVLLTGGLTWFLWNPDGTVNPNAPWLFAMKEASIPLVLGLAVLGSHRSSSPLLRAFLYTDSVFDVHRIESCVDETGRHAEYRRALWSATLCFAASFLVSTALNFGLAMYLLGDLDCAASNARELYNSRVARITGYGFLVIGLPVLVFLGITLWKLVRDLRRITGLEDKDLLHPH